MPWVLKSKAAVPKKSRARLPQEMIGPVFLSADFVSQLMRLEADSLPLQIARATRRGGRRICLMLLRNRTSPCSRPTFEVIHVAIFRHKGTIGV